MMADEPERQNYFAGIEENDEILAELDDLEAEMMEEDLCGLPAQIQPIGLMAAPVQAKAASMQDDDDEEMMLAMMMGDAPPKKQPVEKTAPAIQKPI